MEGALAVPPPWSLEGDGYILLYWFEREFIERYGKVPAFLRGAYLGGPGAVMLIDYQTSNVGPYRELLFIPGRFRRQGRTIACITSIYVSTEASVVNGRANWGIPKELAHITREASPDGERFRVEHDGKLVLDARLKPVGLPFPVNTSLLPVPPLVQERQDSIFETRPSGRGWGRLARLVRMEVAPALFPDVAAARPFLGIHIRPFRLTFPHPRVLYAGEQERS
jgi:hypothetical protein